MRLMKPDRSRSRSASTLNATIGPIPTIPVVWWTGSSPPAPLDGARGTVDAGEGADETKQPQQAQDPGGPNRWVKGSIVRTTPPIDTRGSDRRARPSVRQAFGSPSGPAVFGSRRARPSAVLDVVAPRRSERRRPGALALGADDQIGRAHV